MLQPVNIKSINFCFKVAGLVDIKLGFIKWFFYIFIILINKCKTPYKKLGNSLLFLRNQVCCLKNWNIWEAPTTTVQPTFPRRSNVVDQRWNNVDPTWKMKQNLTSNVGARRWNNLETTLHNVETALHNVGTTLIQRCFKLVSTLVKTILNPIRVVMIMDLQIHE